MSTSRKPRPADLLRSPYGAAPTASRLGDQHLTPRSTLEHGKAMRALVGAEAVESFAQLSLFPGMAHCGGGLGPDTFDVLTPVMAWVETGTPPGGVVASKVGGATVTRTRPVFPYPAVARYAGSGSTDGAASFVAVTPRTEPRVGYRWVGALLYSNGT